MTYPHDEAQRQKELADDGGLRPQNAPRYPRADEPDVNTKDSPEFTDRKGTGVGDRDGATPPGGADGEVGGTG